MSHVVVSRRVALVGLIAGVALAVGPAALWLTGGGLTGGTSFAEVPATAPVPQVAPAVLHDPAPADSGPADPGPADPGPAEPRLLDPGPHDPGLARAVAAPAAPAPPVRIRVVDAGVDAPVVDSGVDGKGGMAVPEDIRTVGWYRFGAGPGSGAGSAVLAGHVDDRIQGHGAFYRLRDLPAGSRVEVTLADGTVVGYRVTAVERVAKTALPADRLFARDGPPRLALVTCGGFFDRAAGGYKDNVVVTAEPETGS